MICSSHLSSPRNLLSSAARAIFCNPAASMLRLLLSKTILQLCVVFRCLFSLFSLDCVFRSPLVNTTLPTLPLPFSILLHPTFPALRMKVFDDGRKLTLHKINGFLRTKIVSFVMNLQRTNPPIYICRHGESEFNLKGLLGGGSARHYLEYAG